ncbi:hypothetical protein V1517DRAFT_80073 [Lipomyces orientalis]|uniref:Uncharacterized protein n=1 Tax=Lipomyces orientalis TaxID=1233043 RepID=A0ACC3TCY9_9ASCO
MPSSNYDKALYLLKNNPPVQRLDIRLPYSQYLKLEESWSKFKSENRLRKGDIQAYCTINADSDSGNYPKRAPWHHSGSDPRENVASSVNDYLSIHKPNEFHRIMNFGSSTEMELCPDGKSSKEQMYPLCMTVVMEVLADKWRFFLTDPFLLMSTTPISAKRFQRL